MPGAWSRDLAVHCKFRFSDVCALLGVPLQVPAGLISSLGKQRMDTGARLRQLEDELGLATFLQHRIVGHHGDLAEGLAARCHAIAENSVVHGVGKYGEN